jgi:AraC-like DNA-binding protein
LRYPDKICFDPAMQPADPNYASPVRAIAFDYPDGDTTGLHRHRGGQLEYAVSGVMTVLTEHGAWIVPPQRALWLPPSVPHEVRMSGRVAMRTVYVHPDTARALPAACCVFNASPFMRELILEAVRTQQPYAPDSAAARMFAVLLDEIARARRTALHLPLPRGEPLRSLAETLRADPADAWTVERCARELHVSDRTFARAFLRETGMTFGRWLQQARLLEGLARLATGSTVAGAALASGYTSPSAFTAMFRRATGLSPAHELAAEVVD